MGCALTPKQRELLDYIEYYLDLNNGVSPSFEQMKDAIGLRSKNGIHRLINALEERGAIIRMKHCARTIRIPKVGDLQAAREIDLLAKMQRIQRLAVNGLKSPHLSKAEALRQIVATAS